MLRRPFRFGAGSSRLSKILDYLIDNLCLSMLSELTRGGQRESGVAESIGSKMGIWWSAFSHRVAIGGAKRAMHPPLAKKLGSVASVPELTDDWSERISG